MSDEKNEQQVVPPTETATGPGQDKTEKPSPEEPGFTQAQVDAIMGRTRKEAKSALLKELGFGDVDALKTALSKLREQEDAQKTEAEKLAQKLKDLEGVNARLAQERLDTLIRMAVTQEAVRLGFQDPADAFRMLDMAAIQVDEDGSVKGAEQALKDLAKAKPYLLKPQPQMNPTNPQRGGQAGEVDSERRQRIFGGGQSPLGRGSGGGLFMPKE